MATSLSSPLNFLLQSAFVSTLLLVCLSPFYKPINIRSRLSSFYASNFEPFPSTILVLPLPNTTPGVGQDAEIYWKIRASPFDGRLQPSPPSSLIPLPVQNSTVAFSPRFPVATRHQKKTKKGLERIEDGLARARAAILRAIQSKNSSSYKKGSYIPRGAIYRNQYAFHQLSLESESPLKRQTHLGLVTLALYILWTTLPNLHMTGYGWKVMPQVGQENSLSKLTPSSCRSGRESKFTKPIRGDKSQGFGV
ncbi:unnamed protein product [Dovyalis caffra]|uniref:Uncharacterized protein n=1 Tax=Dovyalis caffra TaxID=77055 RepID=A0AAV1S372_9ROSI|nr:unnamed protein product [Dovyalis caffra]